MVRRLEPLSGRDLAVDAGAVRKQARDPCSAGGGPILNNPAGWISFVFGENSCGAARAAWIRDRAGLVTRPVSFSPSR
jgi:hypothetical protein